MYLQITSLVKHVVFVYNLFKYALSRKKSNFLSIIRFTDGIILNFSLKLVFTRLLETVEILIKCVRVKFPHPSTDGKLSAREIRRTDRPCQMTVKRNGRGRW